MELECEASCQTKVVRVIIRTERKIVMGIGEVLSIQKEERRWTEYEICTGNDLNSNIGY